MYTLGLFVISCIAYGILSELFRPKHACERNANKREIDDEPL